MTSAIPSRKSGWSSTLSTRMRLCSMAWQVLSHSGGLWPLGNRIESRPGTHRQFHVPSLAVSGGPAPGDFAYAAEAGMNADRSEVKLHRPRCSHGFDIVGNCGELGDKQARHAVDTTARRAHGWRPARLRL